MTMVKTINHIAGRAEARRSTVISIASEPFTVAAINEDGEIIVTFTLPVGMTKKFSEYVDLVPEASFFEAQGGLFVFRGVSETIRTEGHRRSSANPLYEQPRLDMQMLLMQQELHKLRGTVEAIRAAPAARPGKRAVTRDKQKEVKTDEVEKIKEVAKETSGEPSSDERSPDREQKEQE